jgi:ferritin-like metal-binding protein YciE
MNSMESLTELLQEELKDIYDAEKRLTKALPKLAKKATATELKNAFEEHLRQTERHIQRLEEAFEQLDMPARGKKCEGMENLIAEGEEMIGQAEDGPTRDAVMIAAAQKVEHYEIASYGTARTWANQVGYPEVAALLQETLDEEKETDQKLTNIAENSVNEMAERGTSAGEGSGAQGRRPSRAGASVRSPRATAADKRAAKGRTRRSR